MPFELALVGLLGYGAYARAITDEVLGAFLTRIPGYAQALAGYDAVLTPVLAHTTPQIGHLSPRQPFEELFPRLVDYVAFTPLNNAAGGPAISLPLGRTRAGLPIGCHFSADLGDERTLLELAFELEEARPWPRIQDDGAGRG